MVLINHAIAFMTNPMSVGISLLVLAFVFVLVGRRKVGLWTFGIAIAELWIMSSGLMLGWIGARLERMYPPLPVEQMPQADVIVILGGGMGSNTNGFHYAEMWSSADRVWHAVRLYKAGKAKKILTSGCGEINSSLPLLLDFGVLRQDIVIENTSRNTEENAKFVTSYLADNLRCKANNLRPKVLLVTSAWHMRRALLMFQKYARDVEVVPAATDHEILSMFDRPRTLSGFFASFLPSSEHLARTGYMIKEYVGYWGYRLLR